MGDVLGGILGGGSRQSQISQPDPTAQSLNRMREEQLGTLFSGAGGAPFWSFGQERPDIYSQSPESNLVMQMGLDSMRYGAGGMGTAAQDLMPAAGGTTAPWNPYSQGGMSMGADPITNTTPIAQSSPFGLDQYRGYGGNRDLYNAGVGNLESDLSRGIAGQQAATTRGLGDVDRAFAGGMNQRNTDWAGASQGADQRYVNAATGQDLRTWDALARSQANYQNAIDQSKGYISQIATPQIMQQMVLQGLEGGGAVPAAIAQASAQVGTPLAQQFMSEQTGLGQANMGNIAGLSGQNMGEQGALSREALGLGGQLSSNRMGLFAGLSEADLGALNSLFQANMQGKTGLAGQQMGNEASFAQSLPGAASAFGMMPYEQELARQQAGLTGVQAGRIQGLLPYEQEQMRQQGGLIGAQRNEINAMLPYQQLNMDRQSALAGTQAAATLYPLADQSRQLRESDLLRRQGVSQTGFSGIPFTPGSTTNQRQSQQPLFNFFGQG